MRPTKVQYRIMQRLSGGAVIHLYGARLMLWSREDGNMRIVPRRTLDAMHRRGWLNSLQVPGQPPMWFLTDTGRAAVRSDAGTR